MPRAIVWMHQNLNVSFIDKLFFISPHVSSLVVEQLTRQKSSVKMLRSRVQLLLLYVQDVAAGIHDNRETDNDIDRW